MSQKEPNDRGSVWPSCQISDRWPRFAGWAVPESSNVCCALTSTFQQLPFHYVALGAKDGLTSPLRRMNHCSVGFPNANSLNVQAREFHHFFFTISYHLQGLVSMFQRLLWPTCSIYFSIYCGGCELYLPAQSKSLTISFQLC